MEQVKLFSFTCKGTDNPSDAYPELEASVNAWLKANPGIFIIDRKMDTSTGKHINGVDYLCCSLAIFYRQ